MRWLEHRQEGWENPLELQLLLQLVSIQYIILRQPWVTCYNLTVRGTSLKIALCLLWEVLGTVKLFDRDEVGLECYRAIKWDAPVPCGSGYHGNHSRSFSTCHADTISRRNTHLLYLPRRGGWGQKKCSRNLEIHNDPQWSTRMTWCGVSVWLRGTPEMQIWDC